MAINSSIRHEDRPRSGLALGGLGTGSFTLYKDGVFRDWTIGNNLPQFPAPRLDEREFDEASRLFFIVRWQEKGRQPRLKLLQIEPASQKQVAAIVPMTYIYPWMTGVDRIESEASFPFTRLRFRDPEMPFEVEMEAWSPFIPHDVKNSALPVASFDFRIASTRRTPVNVMLLASLRNLVGHDVKEKLWTSRVDAGPQGVTVLMSAEMDPARASFGSMALASLHKDSSYYAGWEHIHPYYDKLVRQAPLANIDDTDGRNWAPPGKPRQAMPRYWSSVARCATLRGEGATLTHGFAVGWHFPNLYLNRFDAPESLLPAGHYYANSFADAAGVVAYAAANRASLRARTQAFHDDFRDSTLPPWLLDQVSSHLNTMITSSTLTREGDFALLEGTPHAGGNTGGVASIDVALYGAITPLALFPQLDQTTWEGHARLQHANGSVEHGLRGNFGRALGDSAESHDYSRVDMPADLAILALRNYFWTGDREYLRRMWPAVTRALEYVLAHRDRNGDMLPDMEGIMCSYDNFPMYGAASYVGTMFAAAAAMAEQAARDLGDEPAARRYAQVRAGGTQAIEEKLWNGTYYRLCNDEGGATGTKDEGCLVDQLIGQWALGQAGLGSLLDRRRVRTAMRSILRLNSTEWGLRNCVWPGGAWLYDFPPDVWVDQANTTWTGVELTFAALLIREGLVREGLAVARHVDGRYRRSGLYFDHQECGGHYLRPMVAWDLINALLGLTIRCGRYEFVPPTKGADLKALFAFPGGWAHYCRTRKAGEQVVAIQVRSGRWECSQLALGLAGLTGKKRSIRLAGRALPAGACSTSVENGKLVIHFATPLAVPEGKVLSVTIGS